LSSAKLQENVAAKNKPRPLALAIRINTKQKLCVNTIFTKLARLRRPNATCFPLPHGQVMVLERLQQHYGTGVTLRGGTHWRDREGGGNQKLECG
jgi:hypothetical protein